MNLGSCALRTFVFGATLLASACGSDSKPTCVEDRTCLRPDGEACYGDDECTSGYCGVSLLPNDPDPFNQLCRQKPSCELEGCTTCARLGELGRSDGPRDQPVCVDACFPEEEASCALCGCPNGATCDAETDRCIAQAGPLLADGSVCSADDQCLNGRCRPSADDRTLDAKVCATATEQSCDATSCYGGTCWDDAAYTGAVCLGACSSDADCQGSGLGGAFACVELENGAHGCRLLCSANNCGGVLGTTRCDTASDVSGESVEICPASPGVM